MKVRNAGKKKEGAQRWIRILLGYWLPPVLLVAAMGLYSANALPHGPPLWMIRRDKLVHAIFFGSVALLVMRALRGGHRWTAWWAALGAFLLTVVYGGWDEYQQGGNPARNQDIRDWYADVIGSSVVFMIACATSIATRLRGFAIERKETKTAK